MEPHRRTPPPFSTLENELKLSQSTERQTFTLPHSFHWIRKYLPPAFYNRYWRQGAEGEEHLGRTRRERQVAPAPAGDMTPGFQLAGLLTLHLLGAGLTQPLTFLLLCPLPRHTLLPACFREKALGGQVCVLLAVPTPRSSHHSHPLIRFRSLGSWQLKPVITG